MGSTVTIKGQVTIPQRVRQYLGLKPGSQVDFEYTDDGQVVLKPVKSPRSGRKVSRRFAALKGKGKHLGVSTEEYMRLVRGYDQDEHDPGFTSPR